MNGKALCYFQHKGVDYKKGDAVRLPEADLKALEKIGLISASGEAAKDGETEHKKKAKG